MCIGKLRDAAFIQKLMKVMKEGIYIGQNTTILCFVLGDHVYFEIPVR
jgi:hypothetical protein